MAELEYISRRFFCGSAVVALAGVFAGSACKPRTKVLKYPENAEEIADFHDFFVAPDFDADSLIKGLNLTGEPKVLNADTRWRRATYPKQNDLVRDVDVSTLGGELSMVIIQYEQPIAVSLGRLESLCGASKPYHSLVGGLIPSSPFRAAIASNIVQNGPVRNGPPPEISYGFFPKPKNKDDFAGDIQISTVPTEDNIKNVASIRFQRRKRTDQP